MPVFLCTACGTAYPESAVPPPACPICDDDRQFVPASGQAWLPQPALAAQHRNAWQRHEPGLFSLQTVPAFGINQRAFLLQTPQGNFLWDCIALLDPATEALIHGLGGLAGIAISHPHYYTTMQDWAAAFDAPVHLHAAERRWVMRPDPRLRFWDGETQTLAPGVTLIGAGGHFPGSTVLHWAAAADGAGALLAGDTVNVTPGARNVSFQWSYPNMLPLPAASVRQVAARLAPWSYGRIYGAFSGQDVLAGGDAMVARCAARYVALLEGPPPG